MKLISVDVVKLTEILFVKNLPLWETLILNRIKFASEIKLIQNKTPHLL